MKKHLNLILLACLFFALFGWWFQCKYCCVPKIPCIGYKEVIIKGEKGKRDRTVRVSYNCNEIILRGDNPDRLKWLIKQGFQPVDSCSCNPKMVLLRGVGLNAVGIVENPPGGIKDSSMVLNYVFPVEPPRAFSFKQFGLNNDQFGGNQFIFNYHNPSAGPDTPTIKVAIIDTGVDTGHVGLKEFLWRNDLKNPGCRAFPIARYGLDITDFSNPEPIDRNAHGTHVAGIVAGMPPGNLAGTNPGIRIELITVKITYDSTGETDLFKATCGMHYALNQGAMVLNCSWGYLHTYDSINGGTDVPLLMLDVLKQARDSGAVIIAAIGNDGEILNDKLKFWPASFAETWDNVIAVGAVDQSGALWGSSNRSKDPNIMNITARGTAVPSTVPISLSSTGFAVGTGTSMAAPFVSRTVAMMMKTKTPPAAGLGAVPVRAFKDHIMSAKGQTGGTLTHDDAVAPW